MAHRLSCIGLRLILLLGGAATSSHADTLLKLTSDADDPIGQGRTYFYTPSNGTFYLSAPQPYIHTAVVSGSDVWRLSFGAPYNRLLVPATYSNAVRNTGPVDALASGCRSLRPSVTAPVTSRSWTLRSIRESATHTGSGGALTTRQRKDPRYGSMSLDTSRLSCRSPRFSPIRFMGRGFR